ncbi:MAG: putative bifunctional diguanylate cyclase/phosphodiesterase [Roseovarius sp.]
MGAPDLRPEQFAPDAAKRLRQHQLRRTIEQMRLMLACNTFFAPALSFQAWNQGANGVVVAWTVAILAYSWWLFFAWRRMHSTDGRYSDMRQFVLETFANSSFWALGMILFYPMVDGDQKTIICMIMAGSLALGTVGFSQTPSAAFVYLSVQTVFNSLVPLTTGIITGSSSDYIVAVLSLAAGISVFNAVLERGKGSIAAFKTHENLSQKTEVIDLLLKDYEEQATEWLWQTDADGTILSAPVQILTMLGASLDAPDTKTLTQLIATHVTSQSDDDVNRLQQAFTDHSEFHDIRLSIIHPDSNETRWILMKGRPQYTSGTFSGFRGIFADATVSITAERKVQYLATYDTLTGLLNRNSVQKNLRALQPDTECAAAFLIDLDGFKQVNDSYGHHIGDELLKHAAARLAKTHPLDMVAARLGGDEFFVLMTSPTPLCKAVIACFADEIVESLSLPYQVDNFNIQLSASVGVSRFPEDTQQGHKLLSLADLALYDAKKSGRNRFEFFNIQMQNVLNERITVTERLKIAVRDNTIKPHYQSQHALKTGQLIGFEALARWFDDELGFVGPDVFIPIAEQTGLIVELGEQLLRTACEDACAWARMTEGVAPLISVNFSPVQFARINVSELVTRVLHETGLAPDRLEIEITEGVLISNKEKIAATLRELSALGVSFALDDFGTGYSSLSYLKELPLDRLKIDRTFVSDLGESQDNPIVNSIIQLGNSLGLSVIAEGIEENLQIETLIALGCSDGQGYFYNRPLPFAEASELLIGDATKRPKHA